MATTTAAVTLTSDLLSDNMSVSASTTCMKAGTTADGLDMMEYGYVDIASGTAYDIIGNTPTASKASKLYIKNHSTDETYFIDVTVKAEVIGSLYAGDWMFIPYAGTLDIQVTTIATNVSIEYGVFSQSTVS